MLEDLFFSSHVSVSLFYELPCDVTQNVLW